VGGKSHDSEPSNYIIFEVSREKGFGNAKKKEVLNFFSFENELECRDAAPELSEIEFEIDQISEDKFDHQKRWVLTCFIDLPLTEESLNRLAGFLDSVARKYNGFYDGWETEWDVHERSKND
jgi:hypothetical protein